MRMFSLVSMLITSVVIVVLALLFKSTGIVIDDADRRIAIPDELTMKLGVKAAYNDSDIYFRFEWEAPNASFYHDYLKYEDGQWVSYGKSPVGVEPHGLYEDRLSFFLDDGSVEYFAQYGGFITIPGEGMRFLTSQVPSEEVEAHEHLGKKLGASDVRKYLPETRYDSDDWRTVRPEDELASLREAGYFLDLWQWRAHRSSPIGWADDQFVAEYRISDEGRGMFTTNWDNELQQPIYMFDPERTGQYSLQWYTLLSRSYTQDDYYYLSEDIATPFDPDHAWQDGDVIPRRLLREPAGSRGDIFTQAIWADDRWHVDLQRKLDTENPLDDKILRNLGKYDIAFAVHRGAMGSRWHYVSFPFTLGLGRDADIIAHSFKGNAPDWDSMQWTPITLIYPGQITWSHVIGKGHAGHKQVKGKVPMSAYHTEEQLASYAVEGEFRNEIRRQWLFTLVAITLFLMAASYAVIEIGKRER